jgi:hypothetical protein
MTIFIFRQKLADTAQYENMFSQYIPQRVFSLIPIVFLLKNNLVTLNSQLFFLFMFSSIKQEGYWSCSGRILALTGKKPSSLFSTIPLFLSLSPPSLLLSLALNETSGGEKECVEVSECVCVIC